MSDIFKEKRSKTSKPIDQISDMEAKVGTFVAVEAISVLPIGAFMKWEFSKDLFVPSSEQHFPIEVGEHYIVYVYHDQRSDRIAASTKLDRYLKSRPGKFEDNEKVNLLTADQTDLGYKVIINNSHWGLLYKEEVFQVLHYGQSLEGFIKKVRDDGKIDVCLQKGGYDNMDSLAERILKHLKTPSAFSALSDKTSPDIIYQLFGVSKKQFKMAVGSLYKKKLIEIDDQGIRLS